MSEEGILTASEKWYALVKRMNQMEDACVSEMKRLGRDGGNCDHVAARLSMLGDIRYHVESLDRKGTPQSATAPKHEPY